MIWIIDASVALRWYLEDEAHECADAVLKAIVEDPRRFTVPELLWGILFAVGRLAERRVLWKVTIQQYGMKRVLTPRFNDPPKGR